MNASDKQNKHFTILYYVFTQTSYRSGLCTGRHTFSQNCVDKICKLADLFYFIYCTILPVSWAAAWASLNCFGGGGRAGVGLRTDGDTVCWLLGVNLMHMGSAVGSSMLTKINVKKNSSTVGQNWKWTDSKWLWICWQLDYWSQMWSVMCAILICMMFSCAD